MLTLITATLNAAAYLERALASADAQIGSVQHIVVDGGSTDDTVAICRKHPAVDVVEVPGCSIYEAWNLGLDMARGDAIMFLNADDELMPEAVACVAKALAASPDADIVAGRASLVNDTEPASPPLLLVAAPSGALDVAQLAAGVPAINAMAFRRSLFARHGRFDVIYRVAGDRSFLLRLVLLPTPPRVAAIDAVLYRYHAHVGSLTLHRGLTQRLRIAREHIALAQTLLDGETSGSASLWLRHMKRRERAVATLYCLSARRWRDAWGFATGYGLPR